jgi:hypothetical protein
MRFAVNTTPSAERAVIGNLPKIARVTWEKIKDWAGSIGPSWKISRSQWVVPPSKCPENELTVSDFAFLWTTLEQACGRSEQGQSDLYTKAVGILSTISASETLGGAILGWTCK